jgi:beta-galactosidase
MENGYLSVLPALPAVPLPQRRNIEEKLPAPQPAVQSPMQAVSGRFIRQFSYSGPTTGVRVEQEARDGKKMFSDANYVFASLPAALRGADYILAANADRLYNAVDLMEIAVKAGAIISVAHDDRLGRPGWLTREFEPTNSILTLDGQPMRIFQHRAARDESLTLGANIENAGTAACLMYIVFVNAR